MELIKCPNCGGDVSSNASFCTNCGSPLNNNLPRYTHYQNGNMGYAQNMPGQYMKNKTGFHYTPKPNGLFSISNNTEIRSEKNPIKSWCCPPAKSGWLSTVYFYLHGYSIAFANFSLLWELISPSHK